MANSSILDTIMASRLLARLCGDHSDESGSDHRSNSRRRVAGRVTLTELDVSGRGGKSWEASVADRSSGGLGLLSPVRCVAGQLLLLEIPGSESESPDSIMLRVRHCRAEGDQFRVGAAFESRARLDEAA